jgi:hypothetical protein
MNKLKKGFKVKRRWFRNLQAPSVNRLVVTGSTRRLSCNWSNDKRMVDHRAATGSAKATEDQITSVSDRDAGRSSCASKAAGGEMPKGKAAGDQRTGTELEEVRIIQLDKEGNAIQLDPFTPGRNLASSPVDVRRGERETAEELDYSVESYIHDDRKMRDVEKALETLKRQY